MAAEFTGLKALTWVLGWRSLACVCIANSSGSNLLVGSTIWFTNGVLLITAEHSGLRVIIHLQAVGTEGNFRAQRRSVTVWSSGAENRSAANVETPTFTTSLLHTRRWQCAYVTSRG